MPKEMTSPKYLAVRLHKGTPDSCTCQYCGKLCTYKYWAVYDGKTGLCKCNECMKPEVYFARLNQKIEEAIKNAKTNM